MNTLHDLGREFAELRAKRGLTQRDVSVATGLSLGTVNRFENGQLAELGVRKLIDLLAVVGAEMQLMPVGRRTLDDLVLERQAPRTPATNAKRHRRP